MPEKIQLTGPIEDAFQRYLSFEGVVGAMILTKEGSLIRTTLDDDLTKKYGDLVTDLGDITRKHLNDGDPDNELSFFSFRTKKLNILSASDGDFILVVVRYPK